MAPILSMLANTLFSIAADKMQTAAKDHIMKAIDENLDDDAKKVWFSGLGKNQAWRIARGSDYHDHS